MSDLSVAVNSLVKFFDSLAGAVAHSDPGAATALANAGQIAEGALEHLAEDMANAALSKLPVLGPQLEPIADALIERVAAKLGVKLTASGG